MLRMAASSTNPGVFGSPMADFAATFWRTLNRNARRALRSIGKRSDRHGHSRTGLITTRVRSPVNARALINYPTTRPSTAGQKLTSEIETARLRDTPTYRRKPNVGSVIFHWASAILVLTALLAGLYAVYYAGCCGPARTSTFLLHAYAGLTVLGLVVVRLIFRTFFPWPHAEKTRKFDPGALVASLVHWLLYLMMALIPLTGWIVSSAMGCCVYVPGLPNVNELSMGIRDVGLADVGAAYQVHVFMAWTIIALITAHVAAALVHHFILKNDTLKAMLPGRLPTRPSVSRNEASPARKAEKGDAS